MSLLFRILRAAHASGTHHKLALDALLDLSGPDADGWRRVLLANAAAYMAGAKAPDTEFKDFQNHVLHVRDGMWGGAITEARAWFDKLVGFLREGRHGDAAHAAGVLSHYVTDPFHPFHTGQSQAEADVHRAVEWSISRDYDALRRIGLSEAPVHVPVSLANSGALGELVTAGATHANRSYEALIEHYDIRAGVADPPTGLDPTARRIAGELLVAAATAFARVLDCAFAEAGVAPPAVSLTLATVLAALKIPVAMVVKRLDDDADRREVTRMAAELEAAGHVEKTLGEAERTIRTLRPAPAPMQIAEMARATPAAPACRLAPTDEVERAPAIGPRTAERLARVGVRTVAELLAADPDRLAAGLGDRRLDGATVRDWQDLARLVIGLPGVNGTRAQLLLGSGYRSVADVAAADPATLAARLREFATSADGARLLRGSAPPDDATIAGLIETARAGTRRAAA